MNSTLQTVLDNIYARRSIRRYQADQPVTPEQVDLLLHAAMAAPSACNLQPWEFVVIDTPQGMDALRPAVGGGQFYAPMAIAVCARTAYVPWSGSGWQIDCALAMENLLLAATAMGLGTLVIGDFDTPKVKALLDIPPQVEIVNLVYVGHPAEEKRPVSRYKEEAVYFGKYDPDRPHATRSVPEMIEEANADA